MGKTYSTGEAAAKIGKSPQHCKLLARLNGVDVSKQGKRGDWVWTSDNIDAVRKLVASGVAK